MPRYFFSFLLLLCFSSISIGLADPSPDNYVGVQMKKTFDSDTLTEYTLTATQADQTVVAIYHQRKSAQESGPLESAGLSYRPHAPNSIPFSQKTQQLLLTGIIRRLEAEFKENLKLTYFMSSGYLNAKGPMRRNFMAFQNYKPWADYLHSPAPQKIPQYKTHAMVVQRWKEKGVYADIINQFSRLGYKLKLEGFEKLFVQRADAFVGYAQWQPKGILPHEQFPYPGSIQFSVHRRNVSK